MNIEKYKKEKRRRYSPKETLAYFIVISKKANEKSINNFQNYLSSELLYHLNDNDIIFEIDSNLLEKIINYWSLTRSQVVAYSYILFDNLIFENKDFSEENITDMFVYLMRLYSPSDAEEFVENKLKLN